MKIDPRGGHNRIRVNHNFFKSWSPHMAYILGFLYADGCVIDARKSSRTCYIKFSNNDKALLDQIRLVMGSSHKISSRKPHCQKFRGVEYLCKQSYSLKMGSRRMFSDLLVLGLQPNKSLTMEFPNIPNNYLNFFLRGYFDGDGCVNIYKRKVINGESVSVIFVSGSVKFLYGLSEILTKVLNLRTKKVHKTSFAFRIIYKSLEAVNILNFMYENLDTTLHLKYKYNKYVKYINS